MTEVRGEVTRQVRGGQGRVRANFARYGDVGAAFCLYVGGEPVVDLWAGLADETTGRQWQEDTLQLVFSTTKGATASLRPPAGASGARSTSTRRYSEYWPEFKAEGKEADPGALAPLAPGRTSRGSTPG